MNNFRYGFVKTRLIATAILAATSTLAFCQGLGDLVVTPTRVVLGDKLKSADIMLLNRSMQPIRYRLTLVDMEMSEGGLMRRVEPGVGQSAINLLRLSPREIVLQPGESQRIKIAAIMPLSLAEGEYRSHLAFEPVSAAKPEDAGQATDGGVTLKFQIRSVVTIPVFVRHGRVAATATMSDATLGTDATGQFVRFTLHRVGNRSIRGDVEAVFQPTSGKPISIGKIAGLPVYCPNEDRIVTVRLTQNISSLGKGEIEVSFTEPDQARSTVAAMATIGIP